MVLLHWCNGAHYFLGKACPDSGYTDPDSPKLDALVAQHSITSYPDLLHYGATEAQLLTRLLLPVQSVLSDYVSACGMPALPSLIAAVTERNWMLLQLFPQGILARLLLDPVRSIPALFYRKTDRAQRCWLRVFTQEQHQAFATLQQLQPDAMNFTTLLTQPKHSLEFRVIEVLSTTTPLMVDERYTTNVNERIRQEKYPLIAPGHLSFHAPDNGGFTSQ